MTNRTIVGRLVPAAAVAALSLFTLASPIQAQTRENTKLRYSFASVGLVPGQSVRVTLVNLVEPPDPGAPPDPTIDPCWRVLLVDPEGRQVADSGDIELPPGRTRTFTIDRLKLGAGETRTGRIQVRAVVLVENDNGLSTPPEPVKLRPTVEVLLNATGHTMFELNEPPDPDRVQ
jgi:hypothetical protein